ncbi:MAG: quinone oxidoreductase [SAR202 cluster bacterium]|nr:quinone oxidoreductase [SAR202 cluster bacterium]MDP6302450.1 quinone oxidoreductase [SAR202 cluster bacterium]MDP7103265.1 quinone oxidoreductase [SAR202 cluster bacterium]MDP7224820.1 quinone oxidoreductase [SAR202 cluster bacterium]MDP7412709.1 quinone oxidoreductase [SAR202 cluster bacterium]
MKAAQVTETGGPEVLRYVDVPDPVPGAGQALVDIQAIGVNYTDVYGRSGMNPPSLPWIPGVEGAGVVAQVGEGVTEVAVGDTVAYSGVGSSYAEKVVAPASSLVKMPDGVSADMGAAVMLQGMTAHYLCHATYPVKLGDTVLVHAAAGGVGLLLTQMVKSLGGAVIATVSTEEKAELARGAGADHVINYAESDFKADVNEITGGAGIQAVYDSVGKTTFDKGIACLEPTGYMVLYGQASGPVDPVPVSVLNAKSLFLTRPGLGHYTRTREELLSRAGDILDWVQSGQLDVRIHGTFPLSEAAEAHRQLEGRLTTGKLLLKP